MSTDTQQPESPVSDGTDCSVFFDPPEIPDDAVEFAKELAKLAEKYGLKGATVLMSVDTGYGTKYWQTGRRVAEKMQISISRRDGRGRPRTQVSISADVSLSMDVIREPDSTN